jgi:hypothetical protein
MAGHDVENIDVKVIQQTERDINKRLRTEEVWINILKSKTPTGLNII